MTCQWLHDYYIYNGVQRSTQMESRLTALAISFGASLRGLRNISLFLNTSTTMTHVSVGVPVRVRIKSQTSRGCESSFHFYGSRTKKFVVCEFMCWVSLQSTVKWRRMTLLLVAVTTGREYRVLQYAGVLPVTGIYIKALTSDE